jgi:RNA polymerase sigma-70 factor, ECF subfamily
MKLLRSVTWDYAIPQAESAAAQTPELLMDDEAFAGFYQRTARPLWAYLARASGNATLADDLVQESYLRFLGATVLLDGEVACRRYLFRIATNLLRDQWRRAGTTSLEDVPEAKLEAADNRDDDRLDSQTLLAPALARMRPLERQLLWLAYVEGSTHREIAEITGLASVSVRMLLFRARRKMAGFLRQQGAEPGKNS